MAPGTYDDGALDLAMPRSATGAAVVAVDAELFPGTGSLTAAGGVIVAVLARTPVAPEGTIPETVNVAVPPIGSVTSASMSPAPDPEPHEPPDAPAQVHVKPLTAAGSASCTRALTTSLGPWFDTTMV